MKKIFTLISFALTTIAIGQTFSAYKMNNTQTSTVATLSNGYILNESTTATTNTVSPNITATKIKIVNNAATTVTLGVIRTVYYHSPALKLDGLGSFPDSYFCFGYSCFGSDINTAPSTDYTILLGSGLTSTVFPYADNSKDNGQPFLLDLVEGTSLGKYFIKYKLYNVNNANDTLTFTVKYNEFLSVTENNSIIESASDVFPNPSSTTANIILNLNQENQVKVQVYNSLGALVINNQEQKLSQGKNKIAIDCANLTSGLYFVSVTAGSSKVTKRLVINK